VSILTSGRYSDGLRWPPASGRPSTPSVPAAEVWINLPKNRLRFQSVSKLSRGNHPVGDSEEGHERRLLDAAAVADMLAWEHGGHGGRSSLRRGSFASSARLRLGSVKRRPCPRWSASLVGLSRPTTAGSGSTTGFQWTKRGE